MLGETDSPIPSLFPLRQLCEAAKELCIHAHHFHRLFVPQVLRRSKFWRRFFFPIPHGTLFSCRCGQLPSRPLKLITGLIHA